MLKIIEDIEELSTEAQDIISIELYQQGFSSFDGCCGKVFFYDDISERPIPENKDYDNYMDIPIEPKYLGYQEHSLCSVEWFNK